MACKHPQGKFLVALSSRSMSHSPRGLHAVWVLGSTNVTHHSRKAKDGGRVNERLWIRSGVSECRTIRVLGYISGYKVFV